MKSYDKGNPLYPKPTENHAINILMTILSIIVALIIIALIISHFSLYFNSYSSSIPVTSSTNMENETYDTNSTTENSEKQSESQTQSSFSSEKVESTARDSSLQNIYSSTISGDYMIPSSSTSYLTESDLYGMSKVQLSIARNEIYARNGRLFQDQELQDYFNSKPWYQGSVAPEDFTLEMLNDYEYSNINLIASYEKSLGYR